MRKFSFSVGKSSLLDTVKEVIIALIFFSISTLLCLYLLESYFAHYYLSSYSLPQTVMNLKIYEKSDYRTWNHKPGSIAYHGYGYPTPKIIINSNGLRDKEITKIPESKKQRILMLGDSFTFGMGVKQSETMPAYLQKFFGNKYTEVINAGVIGQSIDDAYMYLREEGYKLEPQVVIFNTFVGNDITELRRHQEIFDESGEIVKISDTELTVDNNNQLRPIEEKKPESYFLYWLNEKIQIIKLKFGYKKLDSPSPSLTWPVFLEKNHSASDPNILEYWDRYAEYLRNFQELSSRLGVKFVLNIIPMDVQVSKNYWKKYPGMPFDEQAYEAKIPQTKLNNLSESLNINSIDLLAVLKAEEKEKNISMYFDSDPHFSKEGNRFAAAYLWRYLIDEIL